MKQKLKAYQDVLDAQRIVKLVDFWTIPGAYPIKKYLYLKILIIL